MHIDQCFDVVDNLRLVSQKQHSHNDAIWNVRYRGDSVAKLLLRRLAIHDSVGSRGHRRERRMMGRRENGQGQFFYSFDLDEVVPPDHLGRRIDNLLAQAERN